jgi:hypothetical protein
MEMAWLTPLLLLFFQARRIWRADLALPPPSPLALFAVLWASLLLLMLMLDLLQRRDLESPQFELSVLGLLLLTTLLAIRFGLYSRAVLTDADWLRNTADAIFNFQRGLRPELFFFVVMLFLWQRAASASNRDLGFFSIGVAFRLGILLLIVGGGLLAGVAPQALAAVQFVWLYFFLGLTAVALTRVDQQSVQGYDSAGVLMPAGRLAQLLAMIGVTLGATAFLAAVVTPQGILALIRWLGPLWVILGRILSFVLDALFAVLAPILEWLFERLVGLFRNSSLLTSLENVLQRMQAASLDAQATTQPTADPIPPWVWVAGRYALVLVVLTLMIVFVLLMLGRVRRSRATDQAEDASREELTFGGNSLRRGWRRLRNLARLVRRYGLGSQLLAAISVQNLYANLTRLARQRGFARPPAVSPDEYLPILHQAFPGQDVALQRLTLAYMRVHYGDHPISDGELAQLRADFRTIQETLRQGHEIAR